MTTASATDAAREQDLAARPGGTARHGRAAAWTLLVIVVAVVVSIGTPLAGRGVFFATDLLWRIAPWKSHAPASFRPVNPMVTDPVNSFLPLRDELRDRVLDGDYPLWAPQPAGGTPLGTVSHVGPLGPLNLPYLVLPLWYAPAIAKLLEFAVAIGGMYLFLRRLRLARHAALFAGLVYSFSGFQVVWTSWPQTHVGALIPVLFWAVERSLQERTLRAALPVSVVAAAMLFEGFPAVTAWSFMAAGVYALVRVLAARRDRERAPERALLPLLAAVVLGVLLSAVQLLPVADHLGSLELGYREERRGLHLPMHTLLTLAVPDAFGSPPDRLATTHPPYIAIQSFIGAGALLLAGLGALRRSRLLPGAAGGLWSIAVISSVLIYVGGFPLKVFQLLPLMGINSVGRMRAVFGFALAAVVGIGLHAVTTRLRVERRRLLVLVPLAAAAVVVVTDALPHLRGTIKARSFRFLLIQAWPALFALAVLAVALAIGARLRRREHPLVWVAAPVAAVECLVFAIPFWPRVDRADFYPRTPTHAYLQREIGHDRIASSQRTLEPGTTVFYDLRTVTSHSFHDPAWLDLIEAVDGDSLSFRTFPMLSATSAVATSPILDRLGAAFFAASPEDPVFGRAISPPRATERLVLRSGDPVEASIRAPRLRAVTIRLTKRPVIRDPFPAVRAEVFDSAGRLVGRGERRLFHETKAGAFAIPLVEESRPPSRVTVRLALRGSRSPVEVAATADGAPAVGAVAAADDGLDLVFAGGATVYERTRALPRIRWASRSVVEPVEDRRVRMLAEGVPADSVVLSTSSPAASGRPAIVEIERDGGDEVAVRVRAEGAGYLVVSDALQHGWKASLDGRSVDVREADHAGVAVLVSPGEHVVRLVYRPASWLLGLAISLATLAVVLAIWLAPVVRPRRSMKVPQ